jgi:hypothetical protein
VKYFLFCCDYIYILMVGPGGRAVSDVGLGCLVTGLVGSTSSRGMDVFLLFLCCVFLCRCRWRLCDGLITRTK